MVFPPSQQLHINAEAISGITGSISIACWVVVFSPQIITNFQRGSADGLSLAFLVVWLAGDVFNVLGAVLQGVLPTMVILAVYYTIADIVLLLQCLYYKRLATPAPVVDGSHLSPATPLLDNPNKVTPLLPRPTSILSTILFNTFSIITVCLAGILGWYLTEPKPHRHHHTDIQPPVVITFSTLGQVFGYLCAALYLASRVPQLLLNYRRRSCEGISLLFFLFACLGNLTYVVSILAYVPHGKGDEAMAEWRKYIAVNASWLVGSIGTLVLDLGIFAQFFWYRDLEKECDEEEVSESESEESEGDVRVQVE